MSALPGQKGENRTQLRQRTGYCRIPLTYFHRHFKQSFLESGAGVKI